MIGSSDFVGLKPQSTQRTQENTRDHREDLY